MAQESTSLNISVTHQFPLNQILDSVLHMQLDLPLHICLSGFRSMLQRVKHIFKGRYSDFQAVNFQNTPEEAWF